MDTIGTDKSVLIRGVLISEVALYTKSIFGTVESVVIIEVSLYQSDLIREIHCSHIHVYVYYTILYSVCIGVSLLVPLE